MFFACAANSHCPAKGQHNAQGLVFTLPHDRLPTQGQDHWRFCDKCHGLFYENAPNSVCPAGHQHEAQGFMFVLPHTGSPDIAHFDADHIVSSLPLGGSAHVVVRKSGDFTFTSHVHDSGFSTIRYALSAVLLASNGMAFTFGKQGRVEGTEAGLPFGTPNRNDDFVTSGNNPSLASEFDAIASGAVFVTKLTGQDLLVGGINGFIQDTVVDAAKQLWEGRRECPRLPRRALTRPSDGARSVLPGPPPPPPFGWSPSPVARGRNGPALSAILPREAGEGDRAKPGGGGGPGATEPLHRVPVRTARAGSAPGWPSPGRSARARCRRRCPPPYPP